MDDYFYKITLLCLMSIFMVIKINLTKKYVTKSGEGNNYPPVINIFLGINALIIMLPFIMITSIFDSLNMNIPEFFRILGILDFILVIIAMIWQMRTLGVNISSTHEARELIITGPYKYVRHPLYTLFIAMAVDLWLILTNWLLLLGIPMTIIAGKIRANYEEKILIDQYGEQYLVYKDNTGQLFPKLW